MKELAEYIVKSLVDNPEQVKISEVESEKTSILEISVASDDIGKVIGKEGRIIKAIRIILTSSSAKKGKRVVVEMID
ncbi:KH domain-containing protein [bacterium]|nr:KH domain-containing protein [bacterium]